MLRRLRTPAAACVLQIAWAILETGGATASTVEALTLDELTERADTIVVGEVVWQETVIHDDGTLRTWSRVHIEQQLRGTSVVGDEVVVETLGGKVGRIGMRVAGEPSFRLGERVVVFAHDTRQLTLRPVGMGQGVVRVRLEQGVEMALPTYQGLRLLRRDKTGAFAQARGPLENRERLELFLQRVRQIVESQRNTSDE